MFFHKCEYFCVSFTIFCVWQTNEPIFRKKKRSHAYILLLFGVCLYTVRCTNNGCYPIMLDFVSSIFFHLNSFLSPFILFNMRYLQSLFIVKLVAESIPFRVESQVQWLRAVKFYAKHISDGKTYTYNREIHALLCMDNYLNLVFSTIYRIDTWFLATLIWKIFFMLHIMIFFHRSLDFVSFVLFPHATRCSSNFVCSSEINGFNSPFIWCLGVCFLTGTKPFSIL